MSPQMLNIIELLSTNEKKAYNYLQKYSKLIDKPSLKNLLISIIDQEKEHETQLNELKQGRNIQSAFNMELVAKIRIESFPEQAENKMDFTPKQLMQFAADFFEQKKALYESLAQAALDSEIQLVFAKLSSGELKLKQWVQDRYDLELLTE